MKKSEGEAAAEAQPSQASQTASDAAAAIAALAQSGNLDNLAAVASILAAAKKQNTANTTAPAGGGEWRGHRGKGTGKGGRWIDIGTNFQTQSLTVPRDAIGLVIGTRGETVKRLQDEYICRVHVDKQSNTDPVNITIEGQPDAIQKCIDDIQNLVNDIGQRQAVLIQFSKTVTF